jgi:hypothetical protein
LPLTPLHDGVDIGDAKATAHLAKLAVKEVFIRLPVEFPGALGPDPGTKMSSKRIKIHPQSVRSEDRQTVCSQLFLDPMNEGLRILLFTATQMHDQEHLTLGVDSCPEPDPFAALLNSSGQLIQLKVLTDEIPEGEKVKGLAMSVFDKREVHQMAV